MIVGPDEEDMLTVVVEALSSWRVAWSLPKSVVVTAAASSYKGHRYPPEIIAHCVWLYHRFPLSFREVEELIQPPAAPSRVSPLRQLATLELAPLNISAHSVARPPHQSPPLTPTCRRS